ncbi:MAG: polyamine aminopropyltransferase [Deltaproteobacteria bacterium]|nr:polyamine aminopropyltransferase [Deltaproteobacteria bacterium]
MIFNSTKQANSGKALLLLVSIFVIGMCAIIYELLIGTISSYFMGDSVKQFSITIGLFLTSMGIGSYLSRLITERLLELFIFIEILLGIVGGLSVPLLYFIFAFSEYYYLFMTCSIILIGVMIGLEIPILTRIMERYYSLKQNISNVLSLDYLGAFSATLLFPFIMLPLVGAYKTSILTGILNILIGGINLWIFSDELEKRKKNSLATGVFVTILLLTGMLYSSVNTISFWENIIYEDRVLLSKQTKYQKIVLTKNQKDVRLYLNGGLQFSSIDEHRYHEALIHPAMFAAPVAKNILILGGGEGLAVREILKHKEVDKVTIVDIDPAITELGIKNKLIKEINNGSLSHNKVQIVNRDAFSFLSETSSLFDIIIADLPDPNDTSLARLYSREFYKLAGKRLAASGLFVTQATSPFFAAKAFWCVKSTIEEAGFAHTYPYHTYIPSFGDWGFIMASKVKLNKYSFKRGVSTRFLEEKHLEKMFHFEKDMIPTEEIKFSTLDRPEVLSYYLDGWKYWN